jgi:hypothetical protein
MDTSTVHVAVFDTFADWEIGYATAHIRRHEWQREPGRFGLAIEGLLDDQAHTSNAPEYLEYSGYRGGDRYVDEPAVVDGDLITASGVAPVHFAQAIFTRLGIYSPEVAASWFKLYGDRDPAGFYELMSA